MYQFEFNKVHSQMQLRDLEAASRGVLCKNVFLEISQNSQENTCARDTVNFVKFLRTPFLQNSSGQLLLDTFLRRLERSQRRLREDVFNTSHRRRLPDLKISPL